MTKIAYVYSELPNYIRVKKNLSIFSGYFEHVSYIGANRSGSAYDSSALKSNVNFFIYENSIANGGFKSAFQSLGFAKYVFNILSQENFDVIVFANEELLWLTLFLPYKAKIVCEILDSLAIRTTGLLSFLSPFFKLYCNYFYKKCDSLVEVSKHRLDFRNYKHDSVFVIPNAPIPSPLNMNLYPELNCINYIYVSGSVTPGFSGIEQLISAFDCGGVNDLKIVYSGRLSGAWADEILFSKKYVINLGLLSPEESLVVAKKSLAMFAFYKPVNLNYILASPNKVSDAVMLNKPLIINSECHAKYIVEEAGLCLSSQYKDVEFLNSILKTLVNFEFKSDDSKALAVFNDFFSEENVKLNWHKVLSNV